MDDFKKFSIAFLAQLSWVAVLATSPKLGQLKTKLICISRANLVTGVTRNISKALSTSKNSIPFLAPISWVTALAIFPKLGRLQKVIIAFSRANILTSGTRNISWPRARSTSKNFQSHLSRQYRDYRHSHHSEWLFKIFQSYIRLLNSTCYWKNVGRKW